MANDGQITLGIDLDTAEFQRELNSLQKVASNSAKVIGLAFAAVSAGMLGAVSVGASFEAQMSKVEAIRGASADTMAVLTDKAKELGIVSAYSAKEAGEAFEYMALAGWNSADMLNGVTGVMNLAAASGESLGVVSDIVTDSMTSFGIAADKSSQFADVLAMTSAKSNTNVSMLGDAFKYVAHLAGALNYSVEDTATALGLMANAGIKGGQAGTSLRSMLSRLVNPTADSAAAMEKLGINVSDSEGKIRPLNDVLEDLREGFSNLGDEEKASTAAALAGQEAMSGLLAIVNAADTDFQNLSDSINNATGKAEEMAEINLNNLTGQVTLLGSSIQGLGIEIYSSLSVPLTESVKLAIQEINNLNNEVSTNLTPSLTQLGESAGSAFASIVKSIATILPPLISGFALLLENIDFVIAGVLALGTAFAVLKIQATLSALVTLYKNMGGAIGFAKDMQIAFNMALASNPIGAILVLVASLAAALVYLYNTNEKTRLYIQLGWEYIKLAISSSIDAIINKINLLIAGYNDALSIFGGSPIELIANLEGTEEAKKNIDNIKQSLDNLKNAAEEATEEVEKLSEATNTQLKSSADSPELKRIKEIKEMTAEEKAALADIQNQLKEYELSAVEYKKYNINKNIEEAIALYPALEAEYRKLQAAQLEEVENEQAKRLAEIREEIELLAMTDREIQELAILKQARKMAEEFPENIELIMEWQQAQLEALEKTESTADKIGTSIGNQVGDSLKKAIDGDFQNTADFFADIGKNLLQSLADSMADNAADILSSAVSTASSFLITAFKASMGIASPSKVFKEFGYWIDMGLANGMTENLNYIDGAISAVSDTVTGGMSSALDFGQYESNLQAQVQSGLNVSVPASFSNNAPIINITNINNSDSSQIETTQTTDANGEIQIVSIVANNILQGGDIDTAINSRQQTYKR